MITALRMVLAGVLALSLAACAGEAVYDSDADVARAAYRAPGPTTVTLITSINTANNSGAHSALVVNGAQRLLFDPAGNWYNPAVPERNDVLFGMTPRMMDAYLAFQSNGVYEVQMQTVQISPEVAQQLSQRVLAAGPVAPANCSRSISQILGSTPGFEFITTTFFPLNAMEQMSRVSGVQEQRILGTSPEEQEAIEAARDAAG